VEVGGKTLKFMDIRECHTQDVGEGRVRLEIFWEGELADVGDEAQFKQLVAPLLAAYPSVQMAGPLREGGCMLALVALPVSVGDEDALALGRRLFDGFGRAAAPAPSHGSTAAQAGDSAVLTAWKNHFKCKPIAEEHAKLNVEVGGKTLKFMDIRECHTQDVGEGRVRLEIFWEGELADVGDEAQFKQLVAPLLAAYPSVQMAGPLREGGCMLALVALPVSVGDEDALALGGRLFDKFGCGVKGLPKVRATPTYVAWRKRYQYAQVEENFASLSVTVEGTELQFTDVRLPFPGASTREDGLRLDFCWMGNLSPKFDVACFRARVAPLLASYTSAVLHDPELAGECMVTMPVVLSLQDAESLGKFLFKDYGRSRPLLPMHEAIELERESKALTCWKYHHCQCTPIREEHNKLNISLGGRELRFLDVRVSQQADLDFPRGRICLELVWAGKLEGVGSDEFCSALSPRLEGYRSLVLLPPVEEKTSAHSSLVCLRVTFTELESMRLGRQLFDKFSDFMDVVVKGSSEEEVEGEDDEDDDGFDDDDHGWVSGSSYEGSMEVEDG